jgi:hypothetical protein
MLQHIHRPFNILLRASLCLRADPRLLTERTAVRKNVLTVEESFSRRMGYVRPQEITVREAAPKELRSVVLSEARNAGFSPSTIRDIVCGVLHKRPEPGNWSEYPNIWDEVQDLVYDCEWYRVYDIIEAVSDASMADVPDYSRAFSVLSFPEALNEFFLENGIGWQLDGTKVVSRGTDAFESSVQRASAALADAGLPTAQSEIREALLDLSRRPAPDLTGAIQHGMGALECVARDLTGETNASLGQIINRRPGLLPPPLDAAIEKIWGYSSNYARHISEQRTPTREEAELVVGLAAVVATYLSRKSR